MNDTDWHHADIIAAIRKKGSSLSALSRGAGLNLSTLSNAINRHWPKGETIIANFLGVEAAEIWPSRYKQNEKKQKE
ncbi:helix-turn-helix domain-containing protein [Yersinia thracica]|uniref:helix-turn-helix domain-containing protein n=1 Tax=Yersinia thracica TaxID=2890319 RepID=UPI00119F81C2|nr:helix-turn-helix transcriptional regulator [Yersinia thracica]